MMERSLKLPKKIKPEWKFFIEGHRRRPCGRQGLLPRPSPLVKGDSCRRKNPRAIIGSRDRMRAWKASLSIRGATLSSTLSSLISLARTPARSPSLPFDEGAQSQDPRRLRHGPHCAAVADGLRRRRRRRSFDRPRSVSRAKLLTH